MKNTKSIGSKTFWKVLAIMLLVFVTITSTVLICYKAFKTQEPVVVKTEQTQVVQSEELDHSYEAVRERVNSINEGYGQEVKASYYGETSTMEKMIQQRMFFSNLKATLIIVLILLVIILILVKGFGFALFGRKAAAGNAGDTEKSEEEPQKKPTPASKMPQTSKPVQTEEKEEPREEPVSEETEQPSQDADEAEVAENCQLP